MKTAIAQPFATLATAAAYWPGQPFPPLERENRPALLPPPLAEQAFLPLEQITRPTVPTEAAAYYLNRKPQTMRAWACLENVPIRPVRICGRLAWPVAAIRDLVAGVSK